jgi:DNA polymerase III psi subunit
MALMMGKLYDALRSVDVPEDKAQAAAEEVAGHENAIAEIKSTQRLHSWMLGTNTALVLLVLGLLLRGIGHG